MSKEVAAAIRKELKALGYNARKVSVRTSPCTYSTSVDVTIKSLGVDIEAVKEVANAYRSVRRCEYSGDILMGGNTYVDVEYSRDLDSEFEALAEGLDFSKDADVQVTESIRVSYDSYYRRYQFWKVDECGYLSQSYEESVRRDAGRYIDQANAAKALKEAA
jgi:hypothetical protein